MNEKSAVRGKILSSTPVVRSSKRLRFNPLGTRLRQRRMDSYLSSSSSSQETSMEVDVEEDSKAEGKDEVEQVRNLALERLSSLGEQTFLCQTSELLTVDVSVNEKKKEEKPLKTLNSNKDESSMEAPNGIGAKEYKDAYKTVSGRHFHLYGCDVANLKFPTASISKKDVTEPLHPWFENCLRAYVDPDSGDDDFKDEDTRRKIEEESWLKIISLLSSSVSRRFHLPFGCLHTILVNGVVHETSKVIRDASANFIRKVMRYVSPPNSKRIRSYYLKALARKEKGVNEFDDMEPWEFFEEVIDFSLARSSKFIPLLCILTELIEMDFQLWIASSSPDLLSDPPLLSKIMRSSGACPINLYGKKILQYYASALSDDAPFEILRVLRSLVSVLAQISGYGNNDRKHDFVRNFTSILIEHEGVVKSPKNLLAKELYLLKPNWLSFCLSNSLIAHITHLSVSDEKLSLRSALESYIQSISRDERGSQEPGPSRRIRKSTRISKVKVDVKKKNAYGESMLQVACKRGNLEKVNAILATPNVDVNSKDNNGWTALHEACAYSMVGCVKALLTFKPANIKDFFTSSSSNIEKRVDVLAQGGEKGLNPLHDSIISDNVEIVTLILEKVKTDPDFPSLDSVLNSKTKDGMTCFDLVRSDEMKTILMGIKSETTIPKKIYINNAHFKTIRLILTNFLSKYISQFGLHVQRELMKSMHKKKRKKNASRLTWSIIFEPTRPLLRGLAFQRSKETAVKDLRSLWNLQSIDIACSEIKCILQIFK